MFTLADYGIVCILAFSTFISITRGFIREAISLATWIIAFWVAITFVHTLSQRLQPYITSPSLRYLAAFLILLIVTLVLGAIVNYILSKLVDFTGLNGTDRALGMIFGGARGVLLVAMLLMVARLTPAATEPWWKDSLLIEYFKPIEVWIHDMLPEAITSRLNAKPKAVSNSDDV